MNEKRESIKPADYRDIHSSTDLMNALGHKTSVEEMKGEIQQNTPSSKLHNINSSLWRYTSGDDRASHHYFYEQSGMYVRIVALVTLPDFRRRGIRSALLEAAENWAQGLGATSI